MKKYIDNGGRAAFVLGRHTKRSLVAIMTAPCHISRHFRRKFWTEFHVTYVDKPHMKKKRRKRPRIAHTDQ